MLYPQFRFGNITGVETVSFSLSRGIQPSVCTVSLPLNSNIVRLPQTMSFGDGVRKVEFPNSIISDVQPQVNEDGSQTMVIAILDRRWAWRYGQISGRYNIRTGGSIQSATKRSVRQLASLCLEAMGEKGYDLSQMPDDTYPYVDWDMVVPAHALQELCDLVNSHVCLGASDNRVHIYRDGVGQELPNLPSSSQSMGFDFGAKPGKVGVASGLFAWQFDFPLTPVGLDKGNVIKPIDELSYKPADGWSSVVPTTMNGVAREWRKLAKESVWRWFRVDPPEGLKRIPIANLPIMASQQFFPLLDKQLEYEEVPESQKVQDANSGYDANVRQRRPQVVWGQFASDDGTEADNVKDFQPSRYVELSKSYEDSSGVRKLVYAPMITGKSFYVDNERRVVIFADPIYRVVNGAYKPAKIYLRTACNFYHPSTRAGYRWEKQQPVGGANQSLVDWSSHPDLTPEWRPMPNGEEYTNLKEIESGLTYYLQYAVQKYQSRSPASASYPLVVPYSPDGKIAQVTWSIDGQGFIGTDIHKEVEGLDTQVSYRERLTEVRRLASERRLAELYRTQDDRKGKQ